MRHLFNFFVGSAVVQSGTNPKIDPCLEGGSCNSTTTAENCTVCWGPEHGYPAIPDDNVTEQCFTNPPPDGLGCCADEESPTGYSDCPPSPEWKGCEDEESLQFCNTTGVDEDKCFKDCCKDDTSPTQYADCPEAPFAGYAAFFISQSGLLATSAIAQGVAFAKQATEAVKKAGWIALGSTAVATLGAGITWGVKGSAAVATSPVLGVLGVAVATGYCIYKKLTPPVVNNNQGADEPYLQIEQKVGGHNCCTVKCC